MIWRYVLWTFLHDNLGKVKLLSLHWNWFLCGAHTHNGACSLHGGIGMWKSETSMKIGSKQEDPASLQPPTPHHGQNLFFFGGVGGGGWDTSSINMQQQKNSCPCPGQATLLQSLPPRWWYLVLCRPYPGALQLECNGRHASGVIGDMICGKTHETVRSDCWVNDWGWPFNCIHGLHFYMHVLQSEIHW